MRGIATLCFLCIFACAPANGAIEERLVVQPLHHFFESGKFIKQRVQVDVPEGVAKNAPVVFFLDGEIPKDISKLRLPFNEFAKKNQVIFVKAEHRGYGLSLSENSDQSQPSYVTVQNAIADYHRIIRKLRREFTGPWIVVGYSYAGGLAVLLAATHPGDVNAVYSSSGVLNWPFSFTAHDELMRNRLPKGLYEKLSEHVSNLAPQQILDQKWQDRDFLNWALIGITQYKAYAPLLSYVLKYAPLPTPQFISVLKKIDQQAAGGVTTGWAAGRYKQKLSLTEAQTQKYFGRYWGYQQCHELGVFYTSPGEQKFFAQTESDWRHYCQIMFGVTPKFQKKWNIKVLAQLLTVPFVYVAGGSDPWFSLGLTSNDIMSVFGKFVFIQEGYHAPDRDDAAATAANMKWLLERLD